MQNRLRSMEKGLEFQRNGEIDKKKLSMEEEADDESSNVVTMPRRNTMQNGSRFFLF